jgi:hypothetical protein
MMKLTVACTLTSLMLLCTPVLACGTQLNPLPCQPAAGLGRRRANLFSRLVSGRCRRLAPARVAIELGILQRRDNGSELLWRLPA